jgi:hypothetical protein
LRFKVFHSKLILPGPQFFPHRGLAGSARQVFFIRRNFLTGAYRLSAGAGQASCAGPRPAYPDLYRYLFNMKNIMIIECFNSTGAGAWRAFFLFKPLGWC